MTPKAASLWARSEFRTDWNPRRGIGCGLSAGLVFRRGGMLGREEIEELEQEFTGEVAR
jgi:hypothetical protein